MSRKRSEATADTPGGVESLAVRIAETLLATNGPDALHRARATRDRYLTAGNAMQADLFVAVCTVIAFREIPRARFGMLQGTKP